MKILIISDLPYPLNTGGRQAQYHIVDYLRNKIEFSFVFRITSQNQIKDYNDLCSLWPNVTFHPIFAIPVKKKATLLQKVIRKLYKIAFKREKSKSFYTSLDDRSGDFIDLNFIQHINQIVSKNKFDIIQTEFYPMLESVYCLPASVKKIFIQHEIRFVRNELTLTTIDSNLYHDFLFSKLKNEEISAMNQYDAVVTLTDVDKAKLVENGVNVPVFASPAAIKQVNSNSETYKFENKIVFMGSSIHYPNYDALIWFLENVWTKVSRKSNVVFDIIGDWSKEKSEIEDKGYRNINFKGFVPDLNLALRGSIMVVPIRIGSGMRMKIIDAVNYGVPFITTTVGVEGLDFKNDSDCFIEDNSDGFASRLLELINDQNKQRVFIENARRVVTEKYSVEVLSQKRLDVYKEVCNI